MGAALGPSHKLMLGEVSSEGSSAPRGALELRVHRAQEPRKSALQSQHGKGVLARGLLPGLMGHHLQALSSSSQRYSKVPSQPGA